MAVSIHLLPLAPSLRSYSAPVIGTLIEQNDAEKLRSLFAVFDRVEGVRKLVQAFKSFLTVRLGSYRRCR